ncbi:MAG: hypothetical protein HeimC3_40770 [Candidatus Heimdallarchaeota archaeon LC_3]|nr:MAG: hypothetical protein HeimC3_40770 [Candidatus Heimdallarchaeota archaeon LC_3]
MKKHHIQFGKHPIVTEAQSIIKYLNNTCLKIDPWVRLIPGQFNRRKGIKRTSQINFSPYNKTDLRIKIHGKNFTQRIKIECSSKENASKTYEILVNELGGN